MTAQAFAPLSDGRPVRSVSLTYGPASARLLDFGARVQSLIVPDANGRPTDVALGFDTMAPYEGDAVSFGCTTGPVAGRIDRGRFSIDGVEYTLEPNDPQGNHLHGGNLGLWVQTFNVEQADAASAVFTWEQQPPAAGQTTRYPGRVRYEVTYRLGEGPALTIDYRVNTDAPTPVNLTNHTYFNLAGVAGGDLQRGLLDTVVRIDGSHTLGVDDRLIPTGELVPVDGTPLDLREARTLGDHIDDLANPPKPGYDHVWVLDSPATPGEVREVGEAFSPATGISMTCLSDQPCLVFYSGNFMEGNLDGKGGVNYPYRGGFCFEAQKHTDAVNRADHPDFPDIILRPGQTYTQRCVYRFSHR